MKWLALLLLVILAFSFAVSLLPDARSIDLDKILGQPYYFHNDLSGVGSYRVANATSPTRSQNLTYTRQAPIGVYEVGSGWIFPAVPRDYNLSKYYNFLFSVWANSTATGNATLFWRFYYYRNSQENFLFTTKQSDILPWDNVTYTEMLWQHNIGDRTVRILQSDRLVMRLFINVTIAGTFSVGYDCVKMPSYAQDPTEIRFMRNSKTETYNYPMNYTINVGSLNTSNPSYGDITNLTASDNKYMAFNNGTGGVVDVVFNGSSTGFIPYLQVLIEASGLLTGITMKAAAYNFSSNNWATPTTINNTFSLTTTDQTFYLYATLDGAFYRNSSNGEWRIRTYCTGLTVANQFRIDYLYFRTTGFALGIAQTTTASGNDAFIDGLQVGIRAYSLNATSHESQVTSAFSDIVVAPTGASGWRSNNSWTCPTTTNVNATMIRLYYGSSNLLETGTLSTGGIPLVFATEDLNGATLSNVNWNLTYYFWYSAVDDAVYFRFGSSTYNSRILNFQYSYPSAITYLYYFPYIALNMQSTTGTSWQLSINSLISLLWQERSGNAYNATFQTLIPFAFQTKSASNYSVGWGSIIPISLQVYWNNPFPSAAKVVPNFVLWFIVISPIAAVIGFLVWKSKD